MNKKPLITTLTLGFILLLSAFHSAAHAGTFTVFDSRTFIRGTGQPVTETASFNIKNQNTSYTLHVYNGGINSELDRVSSAVIKLNGSTVFDTNDFNQQIAHLQKQVSVTGSNQLEVELRSSPNSGLAILLEGVDNDPPIVNIISPQDGSTVKAPNPDIAIEYSDELSGIDLSTIRLTVDGVDVTADAAITEAGITYTPPAPLQDGPHTITTSVSDKAGNAGEASSMFTIQLDKCSSVQLDNCPSIKLPLNTEQRPFIFPEPGFDNGRYYDYSYDDGYNPWRYGSKLLEAVDVNGDGVLDLLVLNQKGKGGMGVRCEAKSKISVLIGKGDGGFKEPVDVGETSGGASNANIADLNGDCSPDIVIFNYYLSPSLAGGCPISSLSLNTFLNNGDGTFSPGPSRNIDNLPYQGRTFAGDFNADNHKDIAALGEDKLVIYYGKGDGSFSEPVEWPLPDDVAYLDYYSDFLLPLDFNNDGLTDFVATVNDGSIHNKVVLLLNNCDGTFRDSTIFEEDFSWNFSPLAVSDFDKDGNPDIGIISQDIVSTAYDPAYHSGFTILMGDGNGGVREQRHYEPSPGAYYTGILAKDFNGDNIVDVLLCQGDYYSDKAVVLPGNGDGTFDDKNLLVSTAYCGKGTTARDIDGDGIEDLINILGDSSIYMFRDHALVLFGKGDGTFIDRKVTTSREYTFFIASADFDGDKSPDIAMSGNEYEGGALFSVIPNKGNDWSENLFQGINKYKAGDRPASVKVGDLNGDGSLDAVTADEVSGNISVLLNAGDGSLKESGIYEVGEQPVSIALEDMNGDGRLDIIVANKGSDYISILMNNGDETFQPQIKADMPCHSYYSNELFTGDFTEDGRPDIIISGCYSKNSSDTYLLTYNVDKIFSYKQLGDGKGLFAIAKGDFNEDGHLDLATADTVLFGKGDGTFYKAFNETYIGWYLLLVGDVNRDGHLDLVTPLKVYMGDGAGRFEETALPEMDLSSQSKLVDIDGDGNLDILSAEGWNLFKIWSGRGDGTFSNDISLVHDISSFEWRQGDNPLDTGDMNGDAVLDIIYVDGVNLYVIPGTGGGGFPVETVFYYGSYRSSDSLAIADFNGDNNQDIAVNKHDFDQDNNRIGKSSAAVYWGTGYNIFRKGPVMETPYDWSEKIISGDFNGDGREDIACGGEAYEGVSIFLNKGDETFGSATSYAINDMLKDFWVADMNSDGRLDIISSDVKTISYGSYTYSLSVHTGNGDGTFQYQQDISLMGGISGLAVKDFNGDGLPDIAAAVWYDSSGFVGQIEVFINNGDGTFKAPTVIEAGGSLYWLNSLISDDFNHDGIFDIAVRLDSLVIALLTGNGDGTFNLSAKYSDGYGYSSGNMEPGDFNLDGRKDIAIAGWEISLLLNTFPPLRTPPAPPAKLSGTAGDGSVSLSWTANTEEDFVGYNVYRSLSAGGGYAKINNALLTSLSYTDSTATNGTTYYYTVSALDTEGEESSYAQKVMAVPNPPDTIPPVVKITTPTSDATVISPNLFVSGTINETDATVTVNGISGTIQKNDNTFTAYDIPLSVGENTITTTAADAAGNSSTDSIKVIYVPTASISGVVKDEFAGQPVQWVSVYATDSEKTQSLSTGSDGSYFFGKLVPGEVTIKAEAHKYDTFIEKKTLFSGEAMNFDILMPLIPATLKGTVYNASTNRGIAGVTVTVTDRKKSQSVTTDSGGSYEVTDITPYDTTVTVSKEGYETYTEDRNFSSWYAYWGYFYLNALPPSAPAGLTATPGGGYITLSWNQSSEDLDGYNIYRSTTSGSGYVKVNSSPVNSLSYKDLNVSSGATYYYVITAVNTSQMESGYSAEVSAMPMPVSAPTGFIATAGAGYVSLVWSPSVDSDTSYYNIYRSTTSGSGYALLSTSTTITYKDTAVTAGTNYFYVVTAVNTSLMESGYSNEAFATPRSVISPTGLTATAGVSYVALTWSPSSESDISYYNIYRKTSSSGSYSKLSATTATSFKDNSVTGGTTYYYVITAVNTSGAESGYSAEVSATPEQAVITAPTGLTAIAGEGYIELSWNRNPERDLSSYNIYKRTVSERGYTKLASTSNTSYKDTDVTADTTYYYAVTAVNTSGTESGYSTEAFATPTGSASSITVTSPADGATLTASATTITGMITTSKEIGLAIDVTGQSGTVRYLAEVNNGYFAAMIAIEEGTSTIKAIATDASGNTEEKSITINATATTEAITITANPESGIPTTKADGTTSLSVTLTADTSISDTITYSWDIDGDRRADQEGVGLMEITASYQTPGLYFPTLTVTDSQRNTYTATTIVNVLDRDEMDALLKGKWEGMKGALGSGDIETAITAFEASSQETYRSQFTALQSVLNAISSEMGQIYLEKITSDQAEYEIIATRDGVTYSFYLLFVKDENGLWKIKNF